MIVRRKQKSAAALAWLLAASILTVAPPVPQQALAASANVLFDDMEHGNPFANGWFAFGGSVGGGGIGPNTADLPPDTSGTYSLETGWGSGGVPGFVGGFGRTNPVDLAETLYFEFWINPDGVDGLSRPQDYTLEINLQEDDDGDGAIGSPSDDEFQFDCIIAAAGPCAVAGGGWQHVSIPLAAFVDDNSFLTGGNGVLDAVALGAGGNGGLINVVVAVVSNAGADVTFRTDDWAFSSTVIDDFEAGLPTGADGDGNAVGFLTFSDGSPVAITTSTTPPATVPISLPGNTVIQMDANVTAFAGFIHAFENATADAWVHQDWSGSRGFSFWLYGSNSGTDLFIDVIDNRNPGSTRDDAERWTVAFKDDFSGWRFFQFPFADFVRKEIGNGAPNDGFGLTEVHGWAFGTLDTGGPATFWMDDVSLYGRAEVPPLQVGFPAARFAIAEGGTGTVTVSLNRPMNEDDPSQVSVDYATEPGLATPDRDYTPVSGTLTFVNGGASEQTFVVPTLDDLKWEGTERVILRLSNPVDVEPGFLMQARLDILENDPFDPLLLDDFENGSFLWDSTGPVTLTTVEAAAGDPLAVPGQGAFERVLAARVPLNVDIRVDGRVCDPSRGARKPGAPPAERIIPIALLSSTSFDATTVDHTTVTMGTAREAHVDRKTGAPRRHEADANGDGLTDLIFHFRFADSGLPCDPPVVPFNGSTFGGQPITGGGSAASLGRAFAAGQDWSAAESLRFWHYGAGTGDRITVELLDNRAPDPGPAGWSLVWSDEFDDPAGTSPDPAHWAFELGDGTVNGIPGWGNDELQYYTADPANVSTDGAGNLVITAREADGSLQCYYGPCAYTSARLLTRNKAEFAYGRIESRILVPSGKAGLWPAFWSLGTDIDLVDWPQTGEIDFMEYVSRIPNEIFGTIHGPGYAGGASFGNQYDFGEPVSNGYHTFAVEWAPDVIRWYVDGILYHTATPADVSPNEWVFNDPVYLLLNLAIGGNFGGALDPDLVFPQSMKVDYVRVFQGPDTAERFQASFVDDVAGWRQVTIPFGDFARSADQPAGAPNDGLGLAEVWGYGFRLPDGTATGSLRLDQVSLVPVPPPTEIVVDSLANSGAGSLRQAVADLAAGGTITFDPSLTGGTILLTTPITLNRAVTIDAGDAPGLALDGRGADRVLIVDAGVTAVVGDLAMTNGFGWQVGGCVLNNGTLTLDHVSVSGCRQATDAGDFWQGGGGIYNGADSTLTLIDSTVSGNTSGWAGGGVFSFFNTTTNVVRSTISGNVATDVGGGMRTLGTVNVDNSTLSGNTSTAWHGGAMFITDGVATVTSSTVTGNTAPGGTAGGLFVGTFTAASATLFLQNAIVAANGDFGCFLAPFGSGAVALTSRGNNVFADATCNPVGSDQVVASALLGPLADNGGPTWTHALLAGSPAIDAANATVCPAIDQRGVARPQGAGCDVGAFERE